MHYLAALPHVGDPLPATWRRVREALELDSRDHIGLEEFLALCGKYGFEADREKLQLSAYLHDLGICLHFQDDPVLKHMVILRPSWGTDAVYQVLDDAGVAGAYGHFSGEDLTRIWHAPEHEGKQDELLHLMMKFQLCYKLPGEAGYIAPQLLPPSRPEYEWQAGDDLALRWEYDFMPKGLANRLAVAAHYRIAQEGRLAWRSGVVLEIKGARLEAVEDYPRRRFLVRARGPERKVLLGIVLHEMERIHKGFPTLEPRQMVPCQCPTCRGQAQPESFPLEFLQRASEHRKAVQCPRSFEMVDAAKLIAAIFEEHVVRWDGSNWEDLTDLAWRTQIKRLSMEKPNTHRNPEVFISYAWKADTEIVAKLVDALRERGLKVVRDKDDMRYKDSILEFMQRLGRGQAVVVVLSEAYLRSESCMYELLRIHESPDFRGRVFPIVLEATDIAKPKWRLAQVKYWEQEIKDLDEAMKEVEQSNLEGIRESLDLYRKIRATMARLTDVLKDWNALTPAMHEKDGFAQLAKAIEAKTKAG